MQNFNLLEILRRYWLAIVGLTTLVFVITVVSQSNAPEQVYGSLSVTVQAIKVQPSPLPSVFVQGDSTGGANMLVATSQTWVIDPTNDKKILDKAGVESKDNSLKGYAKLFKLEIPVGNSATYQVQYVGDSVSEVTKVYAALREVMNELKTDYNQEESNGLRMEFIFSEPVMTTQSSNFPLTPLAGLLVGFVFAVVVAAILDRKS